jgi:hypothetical protein
MARLINDSGVLGDAIEVTNKTVADVPFDKVIEAINVIQTRMGITGTTAKEAGRTIAGSVGSMKAAWTNLVTGFADGNADIETLIENLVETIVGDGTENNLGVIGNVLPAIETALGGIAKLIEGAAPKIIEILPGLVTRIVPSLISAATNMVDAVIKVVPDLLNTVVDALIDNAPALITAAIGLVQSLIQGIQDNYQILVDGAIQIVAQLATGILNMLPQIIALGLDLIVSLANGIATSLPALIPTIIDVMMQIVDTLTQPETLSNLLDATLAIILALADGLVQFIPALIDATITLIDRLIVFLLEPENIQKLAEAAVKIVVALAEGLIKSVGTLMGSTGELISNVVDKFKETDWLKIGKDIVNGILDGLKKTWDDLSGWFTDKWDGLVGGVKDLLGIHSPSRVFAGIGRNMALGVGEGWEDEFGDIQNDIDKSLAFDDPSMSINASIRRVGAGAAGGAFGSTSIGNININIDGAKYSDEQSLAQAVAEAIQSMTDRRAAVYA